MQKQLCPQQIDYTLIKGDASAFEVVTRILDEKLLHAFPVEPFGAGAHGRRGGRAVRVGVQRQRTVGERRVTCESLSRLCWAIRPDQPPLEEGPSPATRWQTHVTPRSA